MLARSPKKGRANPTDERVNDQRKDRAGKDRPQRVRHSDKDAEQWRKKFAAETCGEVCGDERTQSRHLPRQAATPAPPDFEHNQSKREGNKDELPNRRPGRGVRLRV